MPCLTLGEKGYGSSCEASHSEGALCGMWLRHSMTAACPFPAATTAKPQRPPCPQPPACPAAQPGRGAWLSACHSPHAIPPLSDAAPVRAVLCRLAAELGSRDAKGPASLRVGLLDCMWSMEEQQVLDGARVTE